MGDRDGVDAAITIGRKWVIVGVLVLISLPVALVLIDTVSFFISNRSNGSFISSGQWREYLLHVPPSYDRTRPTPLVISMHGAAGWPVQQMKLSRWNRLAASKGFIVVYPAGVGGGGPRAWHVDRGPGLMRDVRFIAPLIDTLQVRYNIDPMRIYANGLSNGGGMAFVLSCTLSSRIAAVGIVAAAQLLPWSWCADHRPVPMIEFHGTADPVTPYNGGTSWGAPGPLPNIPIWTVNWARRNGCGANPVTSIVAPDVTRLEYTHCADDAAVVLYTVKGGGHSWPGGEPLPEWMVGTTSNGVDATAGMWAFFLTHPLRVPQAAARHR